MFERQTIYATSKHLKEKRNAADADTDWVHGCVRYNTRLPSSYDDE